MKSTSPRERLIICEDGNFGAPPATPYTGVDPRFFVSPRTANGDKTNALGIVILSPLQSEYVPAAGLLPGVGGFSLTLFRALMGGGGHYSKLRTLTGIAFGDQLVVGDITGGWGVFFQLSNCTGSGTVLLALAELP